MFSASINAENPFYALQCASEKEFTSGRCCMDPLLGPERVAVMGDAANPFSRGKFYLLTDEDQPKPTKEESVDCKWIL